VEGLISRSKRSNIYLIPSIKFRATGGTYLIRCACLLPPVNTLANNVEQQSRSVVK